jgi:serine/threonine protein kinase
VRQVSLTETLQSLKAALADRYTLERELGRGGMATVYLAHDLRHDRSVALKVLHTELAAEILQSRAWQRNDVGLTAGFNGDLARALGSIKASVLYMPCETDLYFPKADIVPESRLIPHVTVVTISSLWGHAAGAGWNEQDAAFLNREIGEFMRRGGRR